jgi:hypothetical protein
VDRVIVFQHHDEVALDLVDLVDQVGGQHIDGGAG